MPSRTIHRTAGHRTAGHRTARRTASQETEVKLRVADREALLRQLASLRASYQGRVHEMNTLYDTPGGALRREGKLLRIRVEQPAERAKSSRRAPRESRKSQAVLLTFKGPTFKGPSWPERSKKFPGARRYKIREEREVRVADGAVLARILEAMGLRPVFRYEKYRSTFRLPRLPGVTLDFDETPIGDFLEAEGTRAAIDRSAALLGYGPAEYITESYGQLFLRETRRAKPSRKGKTQRWASRDMLFPRKK